MPMMTSQIFKSVNFTKTQKSRHFKDKTFFLQKIKNKKKTLIVHQGLLYAKKRFAAEVILSRRPQNQKKIVEEKSLPPGKCFPQNVTSRPMRAKIVISPEAAEKFVPPAYRMWGGEGGERAPSTLLV